MMIDEMQHRIGALKCEPTEKTIYELATIVDALIHEVGRLEARLDRSEQTAKAAANTAACLANGILPD